MLQTRFSVARLHVSALFFSLIIQVVRYCYKPVSSFTIDVYSRLHKHDIPVERSFSFLIGNSEELSADTKSDGDENSSEHNKLIFVVLFPFRWLNVTSVPASPTQRRMF